MPFVPSARGSALKIVILFLALAALGVGGWFTYKTFIKKPAQRLPGQTTDLVPPDGIAPFDPKPLMDKLAERITTDKFRFAVMGDTKHAPTLPPFVKYLEETVKPDFMLTTGDMVQSGGGLPGPGYYEKLKDELGQSMRKYPWWPAIGNHEIAGNPVIANKSEGAQLKHNQITGIDNFKRFYNLTDDHYVFTFRNCTFIALPFPMPDAKQTEWFESELKKANEAKKHIFVFNHMPFYTIGSKTSDTVPNKETPITALLKKYGVTAMFSGHDHGYYRTVRNGIPYIISAGGGAKIYAAMRIKEAIPGDVYYHADPENIDQYMLHTDDAKPNKITTVPDQYMCVVDVDGDKIDYFVVSVKGEKWDSIQLSK